MFLFNYYEYVGEDIKIKIKEERLKYAKLYNLCDEFLKKNGDKFLLTGNRSLQRFLGIEEDLTSEVFCQNSFYWAHNFANYLADNVEDDIIISMVTLVPYQKFCIKFNGRELLTFQALQKEISIELFKKNNITNPIEISGIFVVQPIIQLIQLYQNLYNISLFDKWPEYSKLNELILSKSTFGGFESDPIGLFLNNFAKHNPNIILISDSAYEQLNNVRATTISILTNMRIEAIAEEYKKYLPNFDIVKQSIFLFSDWRLKKTVFILNGKIIFNIYNSASYEIIPYYTVNHYKIANKYVLLRFVLIDLWQISLLLIQGKIDNNFYQQRSARLRIQFRAFKEQPDIKEGFIGTYIDDKLEWKLNKALRGSMREYFPQLEKKIMGTYKVINS